RTSLRTLSKLCGQSGLVPTSYRLSELVRVGEDPPCSGGFADVYRGSYDGRAVALKRLDHPHIVPFVGVESGNQACIVSEWMDHGDVMSYLERFPLANRKQLIMDIARGLEYMHASGLVHGDLKSVSSLPHEKPIYAHHDSAQRPC
ncbi:kinase-like protein, partial [Punctularia strigosozonata HHB-11173 SS5]